MFIEISLIVAISSLIGAIADLFRFYFKTKEGAEDDFVVLMEDCRRLAALNLEQEGKIEVVK